MNRKYKTEAAAKAAATRKNGNHYLRRGFGGGYITIKREAGWIVAQDEILARIEFNRRGTL